MAFGAFPATFAAGAIPLLEGAANTATATPAAAAAGGANQTALFLATGDSATNLWRIVNAERALIHTTLGLGLPLGLLPANIPLYNALLGLSDHNALGTLTAGAAMAGTIGRSALIGRAAVTNLLLSPLSALLA